MRPVAFFPYIIANYRTVRECMHLYTVGEKLLFHAARVLDPRNVAVLTTKYINHIILYCTVRILLNVWNLKI